MDSTEHTGVRASRALAADALRLRVDPATLPFASTDEVAPLDTLLGQRDALDALAFGVEVRGPGFNLFVAGEQGSGRATAVRAHLEAAAALRPAPGDVVYVHDFAAPDRPLGLLLPSGRAAGFARDVAAFVRAVGQSLRSAFATEDHDRRRRAALDDVARRRRALFDEVGAIAREHDFDVDVAQGRVTSVPRVDGETLDEDRYAALSPEARAEVMRRTEQFEARIAATVRQLRELDRDEEALARTFSRDAARAAIAPLLAELRGRCSDLGAALGHLDRMADDLADHADDFVAVDAPADDEGEGDEDPRSAQPPDEATRYRVNVLIDHAGDRCAPVVVEAHPTPENLAGRVDHRVISGGLVADVLGVRAGALHRANGGFLVLRAEDVLATDGAWPVLKRALLGAEVSPDVGDDGSPLPSVALRPAPVALDVKVVLLGTESIYALLYQQDPDFHELFKVKVEFEPDLPWSPEAAQHYAAFLSRCVRDRGLRPLDASAVACAIEHGARLCGDQSRLTTRLGDLADVVTEASWWATREGRARATRDDVARAIRGRHARSGLLERRVRDEVTRGTVLIETDGAQVGQVNGLTVLASCDSRFALPLRITATAAPGRDMVLSVEREVDLSGPIHAKGVLTLRGYLARSYASAAPLALAATLAFEQSYDEVEGDSASLAELLALLSALADAPIDQGVGVTGSIDQRGQVQPVGEVTRKVEGFFAVCAARGLTGAQGVVIPAVNAGNLVLRDEVVEAVRAGAFSVWTARSVDEALGLVMPSTRVDEVHARVQSRLRGFAVALGDSER